MYNKLAGGCYAYVLVHRKRGFSLVELSIVLVILGLLAGGVLAGKDLIEAATLRSQIKQIEGYNTAVRIFQLKYQYMPGDIPDPYATAFGFQARGIKAGQGDGNSLLQGNCAGNNPSGFDQGCGELAVFWVDLSTAGLIDANIPYKGGWPSITNPTWVEGAWLYSWLPPAKLGNDMFVYLFSFNNTNYFGVSAVDGIGWTLGTVKAPGITVQQAYSIDMKMDDGLPQAGGVWTCYNNTQVQDHHAVWAAGLANGSVSQGAAQATGWGHNCEPTNNATNYAERNCYDNGGVAGRQQYSLANAERQNCALSFRFQ